MKKSVETLGKVVKSLMTTGMLAMKQAALVTGNVLLKQYHVRLVLRSILHKGNLGPF